MPRYSDDSREKVRDAVDFVDLVGSRTELRKAGATRYEGLCPFHDERTPSFGINPVEKVYYCFGCGAGGDLFKFVMETEALTFPEALELLADRYNVPLERTEEDPRAAQRRERRDRLHGLLERTAAYYVRLLWESDEAADARAYLAERGLHEAACREFRVGYSPAAWDRVVVASRRAGYSDGELLAAGLAQRSRGQSGVIDRFRGRLMFPWADTRGHVIGFGARALAADDQPKYLNSSENEVFTKGKQVYGAYLARVAAAKADSVVLVEGYTDVIALHQAGIRNVVGQMGTALAEGQAEELSKLAGTVQLCLDADRAGQEAMLRGAHVLRSVAKPPEVRVVPLPQGTDPAEVAAGEHGAREFAALLGQAEPFAKWHIRRTLDGSDLVSAEGRDRALAAVAEILKTVTTPLLREELVREIGDRLGLSETLAASALAAPRLPPPRRGPRSNWNDNGNGSGAARLDRREEAERQFLALCLARGATAKLREVDVEALFASPLSRRAAAMLLEHPDAPAGAVDPDDERLSALMAELVVRADAAKEAEDVELTRAFLHLELARLDRAIATARISSGPVEALAKERQAVLERLRRVTT